VLRYSVFSVWLGLDMKKVFSVGLVWIDVIQYTVHCEKIGLDVICTSAQQEV